MTGPKGLIAAGIAAAAHLVFSTPVYAAESETLAAVQERGVLNCPGHNGSYLGLAEGLGDRDQPHTMRIALGLERRFRNARLHLGEAPRDICIVVS